MEEKFTKLSALIDTDFTVKSIDEYTYKKWDPATSKMLTSHDWQEGYRKVYPVITDQGKLDLGQGQLGSLLEAVHYKGKSNLIGRAFHVKSNGKQGMEIRYFFNPVKEHTVAEEELPQEEYGGF